MNVIKNGEKKQMSYEEICKELGFIPSSNFVKVTTRGTITFRLGKPYEIRALLNAVVKNGFKPSASLAKTMEML